MGLRTPHDATRVKRLVDRPGPPTQAWQSRGTCAGLIVDTDHVGRGRSRRHAAGHPRRSRRAHSHQSASRARAVAPLETAAACRLLGRLIAFDLSRRRMSLRVSKRAPAARGKPMAHGGQVEMHFRARASGCFSGPSRPRGRKGRRGLAWGPFGARDNAFEAPGKPYSGQLGPLEIGTPGRGQPAHF